MSNLTDFFPAAGGGGGGASLPTITNITTAGPSLWTVPAAIKTAITDNGFFNYEALLVGGGGSSQGGEVSYQSRSFTSASYHDASQNTILMNVGVGSGNGDGTGTTAISPQLQGSSVNTMYTVRPPAAGGVGSQGSVNWITGGLNDYPDSPIGAYTYQKASNGNPFISRIRTVRWNSAPVSDTSYSNGIPVAANVSTTAATGATVTVTITSTGLSYTGPESYWRNDMGIYVYLNRTGLDLTNETAPTYQTSIGGNDTTRKSLNNRDSVEGVFGGYGSAVSGGGFPNSGQRNTTGFIKLIYY